MIEKLKKPELGLIDNERLMKEIFIQQAKINELIEGHHQLLGRVNRQHKVIEMLVLNMGDDIRDEAAKLLYF